MKFLNFKHALFILLVSLCSLSCHKDFLDLKTNKKLVVPSTVRDLEAILNNTQVMNQSLPFLGELGSDDYYLEDDRFNSLSINYHKLAYIWSDDFAYDDFSASDWNMSYEKVFYSNVVLETIEKLHGEVTTEDYNLLKGSALFYRAWTFYQLAQIFCLPFDENSAHTDLGIPIRLESDIGLPSSRATVAETYQRIFSDLATAVELLPASNQNKTQPSKAAVYALLARINLIMGNYSDARHNASESLSLYNELIDYNTLDVSQNYPIPILNKEVIFHSRMGYGLNLRESRLLVDSSLVEAYGTNDLRKEVFFYDNNGTRYKGSYSGDGYFFAGLSTNEMLLIRAEANARLGNLKQAIDDIHRLLRHRHLNRDFEMPNMDTDKLLHYILQERRKELVFRGLRWVDLRRLNKEKRFEKTLVRKINGQTYELPPNDIRYVFPIPYDAIKISGIEQNPR